MGILLYVPSWFFLAAFNILFLFILFYFFCFLITMCPCVVLFGVVLF